MIDGRNLDESRIYERQNLSAVDEVYRTDHDRADSAGALWCRRLVGCRSVCFTGGWADAYPEDVKAIQKAGHDLGNHSTTHPDMSALGSEEQTAELMTTHQKVKDLTGVDMTLFRPPFGDYNDSVISNARKNGYFTIQWDVDSLDWKDYGTDTIIDTVYNHRHLGNGSIILCHNGAKYTAEALDPLIRILKEQGFEFVPVSRLILKENYHMDEEGRQISD